MNNDSRNITDEQFWRAFEYVADEMTAEDVTVFEQELFENVSLCEAVAQATRLTTAIASQSRQTRVPLSRYESVPPEWQRKNRIVAAVTAVCCCLLLALMVSRNSGLLTLSPGLALSESTLAADSSEAELLVSVWADGFAADHDLETEVSEPDDSGLEVPDWLLTAVSMVDGPADSSEDRLNDDSEIF